MINYIKQLAEDSTSKPLKRWASSFTNETICPSCKGSRITENARYFRIGDYNIAEVASLDLKSLKKWIENVSSHLNDTQMLVAKKV